MSLILFLEFFEYFFHEYQLKHLKWTCQNLFMCVNSNFDAYTVIQTLFIYEDA